MDDDVAVTVDTACQLTAKYSRLRSVKTHQIYCQYVSWQL